MRIVRLQSLLRVFPRLQQKESDALAFPSLAVLSAFARAKSDHALEVARTAMTAVIARQADRTWMYYDLILGALDKAASIELEEWMNLKNYVPMSDWGKRHYAEGKAEGKLEGELAGVREALLAVLGARGFQVEEADRSRIEACRDLGLLRTWISRAAVAEQVGAIF